MIPCAALSQGDQIGISTGRSFGAAENDWQSFSNPDGEEQKKPDGGSIG